MRAFDYKTAAAGLLEPDIVGTLGQISQLRVRLDARVDANPVPLRPLSRIALMQSVDASNRIEGIKITKLRLAALMHRESTPRNRSEAAIAGYRHALGLVHDAYLVVEPKPEHILQMHRELYQYDLGERIGKWKHRDNVVAERVRGRRAVVRFIPVSPADTPGAVEAICVQYREASKEASHDPLILMCLFTFDFSCIHPFIDGNGQMGRLLALLLMNRSGYTVGRYVSIERLIRQSWESHYEAQQGSTAGWHEGTNDYRPFVRYMLGIVLAAYRELSDRVDELR